MFGLNLMHLVQHHQVGGDGHVLVIEERGHIGIGGKGGLLSQRQTAVKVGGNVQDAVHLLLFHQFLGLGH